MVDQRMIDKWDEAYRVGTHWEKGHSKNIEEFSHYLKKEDIILDLGCGSGRDCAFLGEKGFQVWGVDISKEAIRKAKEKITEKNVHFLVNDAENLGFKDGFFDTIYSGWLLQFLPMKKVSTEIYRVLKKNGIVFLAFLLDRKIISTGRITKYYNKEEITSAFSDFRIIKEYEFFSENLEARIPHTHNSFVMILRK